MPRTAAMNRYAGMAKAAPDSRTPRRFIAVSSDDQDDRQGRLVPADEADSADAAFCTPEDTDTATVRT